MNELFAALGGAFVGVIANLIGHVARRGHDSNIAVVRLTSAVEHVAGEVSLLRAEFREDRQELYPRLGNIEQRVAALEAKQS